MSGTEDDPMLLAAEYALGCLDRAQMRDAEGLAARDPAFAEEIDRWQRRLGPLAAAVPPVPPPPMLWSRLALATGAARGATGRTASGFWKAATAVSLAIAASLALIAFLPRPPTPQEEPDRFVAALAPLNAPVRFLAETRRDGSIAVTNLDNTAPPPGRSFQLWMLPQGATVPISLGVLPPGQDVIRPSQRAGANGQLLVSEEPAGGSATGAPTGTVLFGGRLLPVSPAATPGR